MTLWHKTLPQNIIPYVLRRQLFQNLRVAGILIEEEYKVDVEDCDLVRVTNMIQNQIEY